MNDILILNEPQKIYETLTEAREKNVRMAKPTERLKVSEHKLKITRLGSTRLSV